MVDTQQTSGRLTNVILQGQKPDEVTVVAELTRLRCSVLGVGVKGWRVRKQRIAPTQEDIELVVCWNVMGLVGAAGDLLKLVSRSGRISGFDCRISSYRRITSGHCGHRKGSTRQQGSFQHPASRHTLIDKMFQRALIVSPGVYEAIVILHRSLSFIMVLQSPILPFASALSTLETPLSRTMFTSQSWSGTR